MSPGGPAKLVIAIDGPSGVGKSTVARRLAALLGVPYLNTGAMYRALALKVLDAGASPEDEASVRRILPTADVSLRPDDDGHYRVVLDGESVEERIYTPEVAQATSVISTYRPVRERMVELQRECGRRAGAVVEGRDIGTKVFPETPHKFFVDARPEVRHERRFQQLREQGMEVDYEKVVADLDRRDRRDRGREDSPLVCDETYVPVDTSDLSIDEVVEAMARSVEERRRELAAARR